MKKHYFLPALIMALFSGGLMAETLLTVNGNKIDSREIDRQIKLIRQDNPQISDSPELRNELLSNTVTRMLVNQEARRLKLEQGQEFKTASENARKSAKEQGADKHPDFKQQWEDFQAELLAEAFVAHIVQTDPVSDQEVRQAYDESKKYYQGSSEVRLGEILTPKKADAEQAIKDLKAKKPFTDTARKYSADPTVKQTGGINPEFDALKDLEQSVPPIYAAVKDLKKGQFTSTPVVGNGVFGIFYIHDKRPLQLPPFEQVQNNIRRSLQQQKISQAVGALYQKATITPANK